ncbi:hypothetical protein MNBD_NITROSPINAE04-2411 [hydrothermal vent metagenome]|uniref:Glycosyl transferase family 1 domain-containing protein n=1 Tax=hydrothermal vent metagenome TaxID=652676 RepID=A0A3B1B986_9ZZZZ
MSAEAVHQFTCLARNNDAVYDHASQLRKLFLSWGKRSNIYVLDQSHPDYEGVAHYKKYRPDPDDILVYHFGIGSVLTNFILSQPGRKFLVYHNMTPAEYLLGVDNQSYFAVTKGRKELDRLRDNLDGVMADSKFNARDLETGHGYKKVTIAPLLKDFSAWDGVSPDPDRLEKWKDDRKTILFIGRVAPNKRQDELIGTLYAYKKLFGPEARLVIPGSWGATVGYRDYLQTLTRKFGLDDSVVMPGFIDEKDFHALFTLADVYLSLSEHEGFGVPLLEAMYFRIPVVAYSVCSIPEMLGGAGIKIGHKNPMAIVAVLKELFENREMRKRIIESQTRQLAEFSREKIEPVIKRTLEPYL